MYDCNYKVNIVNIIDSLRIDERLNADLTDQVIKELEMLDNYCWIWNKDEKCFYHKYTEMDIPDTLYYDGNEYMMHPKVLATYMTEYLLLKEIMEYFYNEHTIYCIRKYVGCYDNSYKNEKYVFEIRRSYGYRINIREIKQHLSKTYGVKMEVLEFNHDSESDFLVIKLVL